MNDLNKAALMICMAVTAMSGVLLVQNAALAGSMPGEAGFKEHCVACHANGGNIIKADRTLSRKDREKHGIKSANDIVKLIRKPGVGMTAFDKKTIPDKQAKDIADYIIKTFK